MFLNIAEDLHIFPTGDTFNHSKSMTCVCGPEVGSSYPRCRFIKHQRIFLDDAPLEPEIGFKIPANLNLPQG